MPALAVPYLLPFAEAAGIAIAGLGLMEISKQVQKFMDINPEETFKILTLLAPAQGIMALFNKEAGDDEVTEEIEVEEKPKSKKSKKEIVLEELAKEKGSYASPEAEGSWASPRGRIIRRLKEEGKITDKPDPDYDPKKPKFNWRKFTRGRKADGGRIGFEVGGSTFDPSTLDAQARSIYDAWISAGHPEADVLAYLKSRNMYDVEDLGITSIVNTAPMIGGDGGDGGGAGIISTQPSYKYTSQYDQGNMIGPWTKEDFESWLTDIGEGTIDEEDITWGTQWNELKHQLGRIPTPFNLVKKGITGARNWWDEQQEKNAAIREQQRQKEIEAANLQAAMDAQQARATSAADLANIQQIQQYTGQGLSDYRMDRPASERQYTGHGRSGMGRDRSELMADGGLATMFKRKR
jgi:hypothetical protein